ncbi:hypothetical protein FKP32DRAFT_107474 [Trametes sanguinea]|nr:hypothetical protein FKP32DRAFT_107474 [Trametes sanguinea]
MQATAKEESRESATIVVQCHRRDTAFRSSGVQTMPAGGKTQDEARVAVLLPNHPGLIGPEVHCIDLGLSEVRAERSVERKDFQQAESALSRSARRCTRSCSAEFAHSGTRRYREPKGGSSCRTCTRWYASSRSQGLCLRILHDHRTRLCIASRHDLALSLEGDDCS